MQTVIHNRVLRESSYVLASRPLRRQYFLFGREHKRSAAYIERIEGDLWKTYIAFVVIASLSQDTNQ